MDSSFHGEIVHRLPLAEAVLLLYRWALSDRFLQDFWNQHRGRNYEVKISFPVMVSLMFDSLVKYGSGRQAFTKAKDEKKLNASPTAVYAKLRHLSLELSQAFLAKTSDRLLEVCPPKEPG